MSQLKIQNLHAQIKNIKILNGVNLNMQKSQLHVIMGPNGSGKSTLANVLMGNPKIKVTKGNIKFMNKDLLKLKPEQRAALGLFLAFQYPSELTGVQFNNFLYTAYKNIMQKKKYKSLTARGTKNEERKTFMDIFEFNKKLEKEMKTLKLDPEFADRELNKGFSGGEKKKAEMLQLAMLEPELAVLDEPDSGLDVDALKIVAQAINRFHKQGKSVLLITHYQRILKYLEPDRVHVMIGGKIVKSGGVELARELEKEGYERYGLTF